MKNKGITLLALIVTVIIMIILAGVTINLVNDGGAIQKTKEAVNSYNEAAEIEELELAKVAATDYKTGEVDKDALEENLPEGWTVDNDWDGTIKCISPSGKEFTGIGKSEILIEVVNENGKKLTCYRLDMVTDEQIEICKEQGITVLLGDINLDGKLTEEDKLLLKDWIFNPEAEIEFNSIQEKLADINSDGELDTVDLDLLKRAASGKVDLMQEYRKYCIVFETGIEFEKMIYENGKLYFIEEEVTKEEAKTLERYGVNRTMLGDMNLDGQLTDDDIDLLQSIVAEIDPTPLQEKLADVDQDGEIGAFDLTKLGRKISGLE